MGTLDLVGGELCSAVGLVWLMVLCSTSAWSLACLLGITGSKDLGFPIEKTFVCKMVLFHRASCCQERQ